MNGLISCSDEKQGGASTRAIVISECIICGSKGVLPPMHLVIGIIALDPESS